jgi:hypothetical protein
VLAPTVYRDGGPDVVAATAAEASSDIDTVTVLLDTTGQQAGQG